MTESRPHRRLARFEHLRRRLVTLYDFPLRPRHLRAACCRAFSPLSDDRSADNFRNTAARKSFSLWKLCRQARASIFVPSTSSELNDTFAFRCSAGHRLCHPLIQLHRILTQKIGRACDDSSSPRPAPTGKPDPSCTAPPAAAQNPLPAKSPRPTTSPAPAGPTHDGRGRPARADAVLIGRPVQPAHRQPDPPRHGPPVQHIFRDSA